MVLPIVVSQIDFSWDWKPEMVWLVAALVAVGGAAGAWLARPLRAATQARNARRTVAWCLTFPLALWATYFGTTAVWAGLAGERSVGGLLDVLLITLVYFMLVAYVPYLAAGALVARALYTAAAEEEPADGRDSDGRERRGGVAGLGGVSIRLDSDETPQSS